MEFFLNKEKDQVMKTKEKLCQKRLFRNLLVYFHTTGSRKTFFVVVLSSFYLPAGSTSTVLFPTALYENHLTE